MADKPVKTPTQKHACISNAKKKIKANFFGDSRSEPYFSLQTTEPEDYWSCIAHLSADDILKLAVIEEKFKNIESE